jgi:hypothetical protein
MGKRAKWRWVGPHLGKENNTVARRSTPRLLLAKDHRRLFGHNTLLDLHGERAAQVRLKREEKEVREH